MKEQLHKNLFESSGCLSEQTLFDYIDDRLSSDERFRVEKHLLDCELCADALEGFRFVKDRSRITSATNRVWELLESRNGPDSGSMPESENKKKNRVVRMDYRYQLSAAAALALIICGAFLFELFF